MTMLRIRSVEDNPATVDTVGPAGEFPGSEPIEPRAEFLDRLRREEQVERSIDTRLAIMRCLQLAGFDPRGGAANTLVCQIGGHLVRLLPDASAPGYSEWLSGIDDRERPIRETYRRLGRAARLAEEGEE